MWLPACRGEESDRLLGVRHAVWLLPGYGKRHQGSRRAAGYDYILVDEKSSESTMVSATIDLINQGIDALIISPFKPDAIGPIVDAAKAKGSRLW